MHFVALASFFKMVSLRYNPPRSDANHRVVFVFLMKSIPN